MLELCRCGHDNEDHEPGGFCRASDDLRACRCLGFVKRESDVPVINRPAGWTGGNIIKLNRYCAVTGCSGEALSWMEIAFFTVPFCAVHQSTGFEIFAMSEAVLAKQKELESNG